MVNSHRWFFCADKEVDVQLHVCFLYDQIDLGTDPFSFIIR